MRVSQNKAQQKSEGINPKRKNIRVKKYCIRRLGKTKQQNKKSKTIQVKTLHCSIKKVIKAVTEKMLEFNRLESFLK